LEFRIAIKILFFDPTRKPFLVIPGCIPKEGRNRFRIANKTLAFV
jgi:hypothetical protein